MKRRFIVSSDSDSDVQIIETNNDTPSRTSSIINNSLSRIVSEDGSPLKHTDPKRFILPTCKAKSKIAKRKPTSTSSHSFNAINSTEEGELWVDKYRPQSTKDLAIHVKKVAQVREWLNENSNKSKILVLTGPSGSGKTACITQLAKEFGTELCEYQTPSTSTTLDSDFTSISLSEHFKMFLKQSALQSLDARQKVILIEDHPNILNTFIQQAVHNALRVFVKNPRGFPLVLVVSECSIERDDQITIRKYVPLDIMPFVSEINFNSIAITIMTKALKRIGKIEGVNDGIVNAVAKSSQGDIRCAINQLQFSSLFTDDDFSLGTRDPTALLFSVLGSILYIKREGNFEFKFDPDTIIKDSFMDSTFIQYYIHQNYTHFMTTIEECTPLIEFASQSDLLPDGYSDSVFVRGCLLKPRTSTMSYRQFYKSQFWESRKKAIQCGDDLKMLYLNLGAEILQSGKSVFAREVLSYLSKTGYRMNDRNGWLLNKLMMRDSKDQNRNHQRHQDEEDINDKREVLEEIIDDFDD